MKLFGGGKHRAKTKQPKPLPRKKRKLVNDVAGSAGRRKAK